MNVRSTFWPSLFVFIGLLLVYLFAVNFSGKESDVVNNNEFKLESSAFANMGKIPSNYTCDADVAINPPLKISGVPEGTKSMVLFVTDPDIPESVKTQMGIDVFDHWVVYGISADVAEIPENVASSSAWANEGLNSAGTVGYRSPCPPDGEHRYFFRLYALNGNLSFEKTPTKVEVETAMKKMIIDETELVGLYERQ